MTFEFTAPIQKVATTGFRVGATSRAGVAEDEWIAGRGTDWSGTISIVTTNTGDAGGDELLTWSNSSVSNIRAELRDGKGKAYGYIEVHHLGVRRQKALRGGSVTVIFDSSTTWRGCRCRSCGRRCRGGRERGDAITQHRSNEIGWRWCHVRRRRKCGNRRRA